ncbi:integrase catalytic region [Bifidobacterium longum]|nr:integrase catalytic region [Bifidobacterium longum]
MDLRGLGSSGPSALICWGRYGSYMPVAGFVLRTSSRLAVDAGRLSVRAIPRTLMPAFRQSAMLMRSSWLRYLELIFWGMSTVERYQSTDGFSFLPFDRVLPLRHTLPVRLDTPTARAACVKFMPASRCSTYRRRRAAHISPRVAYSTPSNTHLPIRSSYRSIRCCNDH